MTFGGLGEDDGGSLLMERRNEERFSDRRGRGRRRERKRTHLHDFLEERLSSLAEYGVSLSVGDEARGGEEDVSSWFGGPSSESARRGRERSRQVEG